MHRDLLEDHGFVGSMSRRGNPYDNPQAESFMKTLKVEDAYLMDYETFEDVADGVPASSKPHLPCAFSLGVSQPRPVRGPQRPQTCQTRRLIAPRGAHRRVDGPLKMHRDLTLGFRSRDARVSPYRRATDVVGMSTSRLHERLISRPAGQSGKSM